MTRRERREAEIGGGVPCQGGCGRMAAGLGIRTYLCAPCASRQARRVRAAAFKAVAERVRAGRHVVVTQ